MTAYRQAEELIVQTAVRGGNLQRRSQNELIADVEKLVSDYRRGQPEFSRGTSLELQERGGDAAAILNRSNPQAGSLFQAVSTFLSYDQRARYFSAVSTAVENTLSTLV